MSINYNFEFQNGGSIFLNQFSFDEVGKKPFKT